MQNMDSIVVGGGPGGYTCAAELAQAGHSVALIERDALGGTCLNRGCIPTKALLATAEAASHAKAAKALGVSVADIAIDYPAAMKRKERVVLLNRKGVQQKLKQAGVNVIEGEAEILDKHTVRVGGESYTCKHLVIATGSKPSQPPIEGIEHAFNSDVALQSTDIPGSIAILGGGVIGCEFAQLYAALGSKVTIFEAMPALLPQLDADLGNGLQKSFAAKRIKAFPGAKVERIVQTEDGLCISCGGQEQLFDACLCATGRTPVLPKGADALGLQMDGSWIAVQHGAQTSVDGVFAIGDVSSRMMLAHVATAQAMACVRLICGEVSEYSDALIPSCVYTTPEVGSVGYSETAAQEAFGACKTAVAPMAANGRAAAAGTREGFVKLVAREDGSIVGLHMLGLYATEIISPMAALLQRGVTAKELAQAVFAHPTISESIGEAAHQL